MKTLNLDYRERIVGLVQSSRSIVSVMTECGLGDQTECSISVVDSLLVRKSYMKRCPNVITIFFQG